jgi:hypothetical protein
MDNILKVLNEKPINSEFYAHQSIF